uniref:TM2 domain-containing protein 1 n=1 Tax=Pristiophorus japonicus TaxID=55135 RepID=UPI00398F6FFA
MALPRESWLLRLVAGFLCFCFLNAVSDDIDKCDELRLGQYICDTPKISDVTQEPENCTNNTAFVPCMPAPNITCKNDSGLVNTFSGKEVGFYKPFSCRNVTGYSYKVAVALSLFLGWLGADRFYLGYPALGTLCDICTEQFKITTSAFSQAKARSIKMKNAQAAKEHDKYAKDTRKESKKSRKHKLHTVGQIVGPADGSSYIIDYYGARLTRLTIDNDTYRKTQMDL